MARRAGAVIVAALAATAQASTGAPIAKVFSMLDDLSSKIVKEGETAQKVYAEYAEFCEDRSRDLSHEIKTGKAEVESLTATIQEETATIASKNTKVEELAAAIASNDADLKSAREVRAKEAKDFAAAEKELVSTIDMIARASTIIQRQMQKGNSALVQLQSAGGLVNALDVMVKASLIGAADAKQLSAFVQQSSSQEDEDVGAPAAAVYESKSGGILEALEGLQDKAEAQLEDSRKAETTARHNFEMVEQSLQDEIKFANKELAEAKQAIAAATEKQATAQGELDSTSKELAADEESLQTLHHDCTSKSADFETETKSRGEELAAIAKAKQVIEEATSGSAEEVSFAQLRLDARAERPAARALRLVRGLARRQGSSELAMLATRMASVVRHGGTGKGPFDKVKSMISDMIARLEKEASEAATKKAYCDKEMTETTAKKELRSDELQALATKMEAASAKAAQLKEEVATLQKEMSALLKGQAEMDKLRGEEKATFEETKAELERGLAGLREALRILREYYGQDGGHSKKDGAAGGVVSLLEVCESDFAKNLAEITAEEEAAAAAYEEDSKANQIEKVAKEGDIKYKTKEAKELDKTAAELRSDHEGVSEELDAVMEYLSRITAECTVKPESYEERQRRRSAELQGLREALQVLDAPALIQRMVERRSLRVRRAA